MVGNPKGPVTSGLDHNFFKKVTVTSENFVNDADALITVKYVRQFSFVNEGADVIQYSFNGNTLHGDLTPGTPTAAIIFDNRPVTKIWFRLTGSGSSVVRVEAWGA